jgi:Txe/YoeB family toxin of Txe-Axe toxin-antitoxin module
LEFDPAAFDDLAWWIVSDRKVALTIVKLVEAIQRAERPQPEREQMPFQEQFR